MKIAVIGTATDMLHAQVSRQLAERGHEAVFVGDISDFKTERLGSLNEVLKDQNETLAKSIYEITRLDMDEEFYNPSFQINNRQARRKAEKEAKKVKNKYGNRK